MANNVLITGCSSGFGLLSALEFARNDDTVFASMRNLAKSGDLEKAAAAEGLSVHIAQLDVTDPQSITRCVDDIIAKAGSIDVLVNNAGVELQCPVEEATDEEVQWQFDTNVFGTLRVIRAVVPHMRAQKRGAIVNLSSVAGVVGPPYSGLYAATKHAIEGFSEALHFELQAWNIRVSLIEPGLFETNFGSNIRMAAAWNEQSPYWERFQKFMTARAKLAPEPQDNRIVAQAICDAAYSEAPQFRRPAGADAALVTGAHKSLTFEAYENAMRQTLDWWE